MLTNVLRYDSHGGDSVRILRTLITQGAIS